MYSNRLSLIHPSLFNYFNTNIKNSPSRLHISKKISHLINKTNKEKISHLINRTNKELLVFKYINMKIQ